MIDASLPLLQTKLYRPRVLRGLVARPHLWALLNRGLDKPLTLICAGPGFGKTTLVTSWLEELAAHTDAAAPIPVAWLALDENDNDLVAFLRYFVAALQTAIPDACSETAALLQSSRQSSTALFTTTLINDLARLPRRTILVLDDYSALQSAEVNDLLVALVHNWPPPLHLVLVTRHNPPLPLPTLRARGAITELRTQQLRFSLAETTAYLEQALEMPVDEATVDALEQRAEGWIAGLKLATLSLDTGTSTATLVAALANPDVNVTEYLTDEVLSRQPPAVQAFLLQTSVLDHFCASLCTAVIGELAPGWDAAACIQWLVRTNLFIITLDNQNEWYRYHHLFRDMLRQHARTALTADQVLTLRRRAAAWFAARRLVDEALHYALATGDLELTVRLIEAGLPDALNREDRLTLERWLSLLPATAMEHEPVLLMLKVWALQFSWQLGAQSRLLSQIEALIDRADSDVQQVDAYELVRTQITVLRGQEAYFCNQPQLASAYLTAAFARLPETWTYLRGGTLLYLAMSMQASGQAGAAERLLREQYERHSNRADGFTLRLQSALCFNYLAQGKLEQTRQTAHEMLHLAVGQPLLTMQSFALYFLGLVHYQWNDLAIAERYLTMLLDHRHVAVMVVVRDGLLQLALTHQVCGRAPEAAHIVDLLGELEMEQSGREEDATRAMRAWLRYRQGDLAGAARWADAFDLPVADQPLIWQSDPHLAKALILIARQGGADLVAACDILDSLYAVAERTGNTRSKIQIQAMRALALDQQGTPAAAEAALREAVELGRPGGFVRVFVDLGPPMHALLARLAQQGVAVQPLLAAFAAEPDENRARETGGMAPAAPSGRGSLLETPSLVKLLTAREREVLALLREPLSNKEIARRLNVSTVTVKRHTANIYGKLGVNSRWDAVAKAAALQQGLTT